MLDFPLCSNKQAELHSILTYLVLNKRFLAYGSLIFWSSEERAPCYRTCALSSTINHAEAWNRALMYEVLKHKRSSRVGTLIFAITEYCVLRVITLVSMVGGVVDSF